MKLTSTQEAALPDLVAFAMIGYALVADRAKPLPPKDHPKIAPFLDLVGPELDRRERIQRLRRALDWGTEQEVRDAAANCTLEEQHCAFHQRGERF